MPVPTILLIALVVVVVMLLAATLKIIRQQQVAIVERLGKFRKVLDPGPHLVVPFLDQIRYALDMREEVVPFPPQGVITEDNLIVSIDSVIYFQIVDPVRAAYEAQNYRAAIEQLTMTTLRNIIGGMDLEATLTSREEINKRLRAVLDEATGKWGIKVNRVELRTIEPPPTIRDAMESGHRSCWPKVSANPRSFLLAATGRRQFSAPKVIARPLSSAPRPTGRHRCCVPRVRPRPSPRFSAPSTPQNRIRRCSPTSTCRCCRA